MLARSTALRRGAKALVAISVLAIFIAAGSIADDAVTALVSATVIGF